MDKSMIEYELKVKNNMLVFVGRIYFDDKSAPNQVRLL